MTESDRYHEQSPNSNHIPLGGNMTVGTVELEAIVYQALRKVSGQYKDTAINRSASLRKDILKETRNLCKELRPEVSDNDWHFATQSLAYRLTK